MSTTTTWYGLTDAGDEAVAALSRIDARAELVACGDDTCAHLAPPVAPTCCE